MKEERPRNLAASVKARLRAVAQREQKPFDEVFLLYLQERLLHRLATSEYRGKFVLKGGLLIYGRKGRMARPTRDIDLLGVGLTNDPDQPPGVEQGQFDLDLVESVARGRGENKTELASSVKSV